MCTARVVPPFALFIEIPVCRTDFPAACVTCRFIPPSFDMVDVTALPGLLLPVVTLFRLFLTPLFALVPLPFLQEKVIAEKEAALLKEQELYNRLRNKDYGPAIALALELKRPQKLWGVLRDAMTEGMGESVPGAASNEGERGISTQQAVAAVYSTTASEVHTSKLYVTRLSAVLLSASLLAVHFSCNHRPGL